MKGIVFLGDRELELREFPDPAPGPGEVVIAIRASGMCGSDLHAYRASRSGNVAGALASAASRGRSLSSLGATSRAGWWRPAARASRRRRRRSAPG